MYLEGNQNLLHNLCIECASVLQRKYPHVAWGVKPSVDGSMIIINPVSINTGNYAFTEKTTVLQQATGRDKLLMMIGGVILEHFRIKREPRKIVDSDAKMNKRGQLIPDL